MEKSNRDGLVVSTSSGIVFDDLDTKTIEEAQDTFEKIFIQVREIMRDINNALDSENLNVCHQIARSLSRNFKEK